VTFETNGNYSIRYEKNTIRTALSVTWYIYYSTFMYLSCFAQHETSAS